MLKVQSETTMVLSVFHSSSSFPTAGGELLLRPALPRLETGAAVVGDTDAAICSSTAAYAWLKDLNEVLQAINDYGVC